MDGSQKNRLAWRVQHLVVELKRRKVFQVTSVYLVAAWGLSAGAADIFEVLGFPAWASRYFVIAIFSLTPLVIVIAWVFELSKSGIQRDYGPNSPTDQTTVLAARKNTAVLTTSWLGRRQTFANDFIVGRDDSCALQIVDPLVSRRHAKFEFVDGRWRIRDLGSANGTVVNGKKVDVAWLDDESSVNLYPDGPALKLTIGNTASAETKLASQIPS